MLDVQAQAQACNLSQLGNIYGRPGDIGIARYNIDGNIGSRDQTIGPLGSQWKYIRPSPFSAAIDPTGTPIVSSLNH